MRCWGDDKGMTLIETMVGVGILATVITATGSYFQYTSQESMKLSESLARMDLERQGTASLSNPLICSADLTPPNLKSAITFDSTKISAGKPVVVPLNTLIANTAAGSSPLVSVGSVVSPMAKEMTVKNMQLNITSATTATIEIDFVSATLPRAIAPLMFPVNLQTTGSAAALQIVGCSTSTACPAGQLSVTDSSGKPTCQSLSSLIASLCPSGGQVTVSGGAVTCSAPPPPPPAYIPPPTVTSGSTTTTIVTGGGPTPTPTPPNYNNWSVSVNCAGSTCTANYGGGAPGAAISVTGMSCTGPCQFSTPTAPYPIGNLNGSGNASVSTSVAGYCIPAGSCTEVLQYSVAGYGSRTVTVSF